MKNVNKKYLVNSWVITAFAVVIVVLVNMVAASLTNKFSLKLDFTKNSQYAISDQTSQVMKSLDTEVHAMVMGMENETEDITREYLQKYAAMSDKFKVEYIDVYKNQVVLNRYQSKGESLTTGDIILECGERYKIIKSDDLYNQALSFEPGVNNYSFALESKLTNGIVVLTGLAGEKAVYFMEGHGEIPMDTMVKTLDTMGYKNETVNLINSEIPEDAGLIVSVVPSADFSQEECEKLDKFFDGGGNFLMIFSPGMPKLSRVDSLLAEWGIVPNYDIVLEKDPEKVLQYEIAMLTDTYGHEITQPIRLQALPLVSYYTSSFSVLSTNINNATSTVLMETTNQAIGKANPESENNEFEDGDFAGPLPVAIVSEKTSPKDSRLMVIGSVGTVQLATQYEGNNEFLSASISWLTNDNNNLKISPKIISQGAVQVTNATLTVMTYLLVWIIPVLILIAGIIIWIRRRYL